MVILLNLSRVDGTVFIGIVEEEVFESCNEQGASSSVLLLEISSLVLILLKHSFSYTGKNHLRNEGK